MARKFEKHPWDAKSELIMQMERFIDWADFEDKNRVIFGEPFIGKKINHGLSDEPRPYGGY